MSKYTIMPEGCRWIETEAKSAETAYNKEAHWFKPSNKIAVMDNDTGITKIYTRQLDAAGNLMQVLEH